jgi:hypothetical protein
MRKRQNRSHPCDFRRVLRQSAVKRFGKSLKAFDDMKGVLAASQAPKIIAVLAFHLVADDSAKDTTQAPLR